MTSCRYACPPHGAEVARLGFDVMRSPSRTTHTWRRSMARLHPLSPIDNASSYVCPRNHASTRAISTRSLERTCLTSAPAESLTGMTGCGRTRVQESSKSAPHCRHPTCRCHRRVWSLSEFQIGSIIWSAVLSGATCSPRSTGAAFMPVRLCIKPHRSERLQECKQIGLRFPRRGMCGLDP